MIWKDVVLEVEGKINKTDLLFCAGDNRMVGLKIKIIDKLGEITDSEITNAKIVFVKKDGVVFSDLEGTYPNYQYIFKGTEISTEGPVVSDVKLYSNDERVSSSKFTFIVTNDTLTDAAKVAGTYIDDLEKLVKVAQDMVDSIKNVALMGEATTNVLGAVKYDGVTIKKNDNGQLYGPSGTDNLLATKLGTYLEARQGKVLNDKVTELNSNIGKSIVLNYSTQYGNILGRYTKYNNLISVTGTFTATTDCPAFSDTMDFIEKGLIGNCSVCGVCRNSVTGDMGFLWNGGGFSIQLLSGQSMDFNGTYFQ